MSGIAQTAAGIIDLPATDIETLRNSALRKNARRLVPILTLALVFNYIDRTSVGFAALTMNTDLGLTATEFGWGAGVLFAGYCLFEVPSGLIQYRVGARRWLGRIMITWGLVAALTGLVAAVVTLLIAFGVPHVQPGVVATLNAAIIAVFALIVRIHVTPLATLHAQARAARQPTAASPYRIS